MNNLSSYCGLFDAKIRASDKDLPVLKILNLADFRDLAPMCVGRSQILMVPVLFGWHNLHFPLDRKLPPEMVIGSEIFSFGYIIVRNASIWWFGSRQI